jgi:hypothetical protein
MQNFDDYQTFTDATLVMPLEKANNVGYSTLGLVGEVGEYAKTILNLAHINPKATDCSEEFLSILSEVTKVCAKAENLKKEVRRGDKTLPNITIFSTDERDEIVGELGDIFWYASRAASSIKMKLSQVIGINVSKLIRRMQAGIISGWGKDK